MSVVDVFSSVSNNKNNFRKDAKVQRNDYHFSVFLRDFASSREKLILSVRALSLCVRIVSKRGQIPLLPGPFNSSQLI